MKGYMGKILRVNLTEKKISTIDTKDYQQWGGGHGMGSAIFWDLVEDKTISAFDPKNVVTIMTSPLVGTLTPSAASRTEVQGIGPQSWPYEWFTRSNFGGRFAPMLKYAGWDGIIVEGKSESPVWLDIRNHDVKIKDATGYWGMDTYETQQEIWDEVNNGEDYGNWNQVGTGRDGGSSTQRPAVVAIGQAGENLSRIACLVHDAGNGAGQGGFGGVFGSKNLKAISVIGTGSVEVADPNALMQARIWLKEQHGYNVDNPLRESPVDNFALYGTINRSPGFGPLLLNVTEPSRPKGCVGCYMNCRRKTSTGNSNESSCVESLFYTSDGPEAAHIATDYLQKYGINVYGILQHGYLRDLYKMGVLGPGKEIHSELPYEKYGKLEFAEALTRAIAYREDIGEDLAEGLPRAIEKWGRLEDIESGLIKLPNWGYNEHYDPRLEVEWSYGSILGDRDINEHCLNFSVHWLPLVCNAIGQEPIISAEDNVNTVASKLVIYDDPMMLDYSEEGIYSEAKAKMISWHRYYTRFWKQSMLYCDWAWPFFVNANVPDFKGFTPEGEPKFYNAVTGKNITFEEGMAIGRKIWNLDRAIWILQGRHRDQEVFAGYVYDVPTSVPYELTVFENGKWIYSDCLGRTLDRQKFEDWKTMYFELEGWEPSSGWPKRSTLEEIGLGYVADELEAKGKLGGE